MKRRTLFIIAAAGLLAMAAVLPLASDASASTPETKTTSVSPASFNAADFVWLGYKSCFQMMPSDKQIVRKAPNTHPFDWMKDNGEACQILYNAEGFSDTNPEFTSFWISAIASSPGFSSVRTNSMNCCLWDELRIKFYEREAGYYYKHRAPKTSVHSVEDAHAIFGGCSRFWNAWLVETADGPEQSFVYDARKHRLSCMIPIIIVPRGFVAINANGDVYFPRKALFDVKYVEIVPAGTYSRMTD